MKSWYAYWIIALFYLLFGLSFDPVNEAADSYRYAEQFQIFAISPTENYKHVLGIYFGEHSSTQGQIKDIYVYTMYYLAAIIGGNNVHILFFLFSAVFTFFALKSLKYITNNPSYRNYAPMYILLFLFIYSNNIFNINGVRFWTASWVAVYLAFKILIDRKLYYSIFLLALPLIHASFTVFIAFFVIAYFFRSKTPILCKLYIVSFFFGEIGLQMVDYVHDYMPKYIQQMIWSYTASDWAANKMNGTEEAKEALYARVMIALPRYYEFGLLYLASKKSKLLRDKNLLGFTLAFFSCINLTAIIPSMGRYYVVGYPLIIYIWVNEFNILKCYIKYIYLAPFVYSYAVFRWIKSVLSVTDIMLYTSNTFHIIYRGLSK